MSTTASADTASAGTTPAGTTPAGSAPTTATPADPARTLTGRRDSLRQALAARRARRAARLRLERDLATYRTPAERHEIEAIVARYDGAGTAEVERILTAQSAARIRDERHLFAVAR